jgi:hypothetical protein
VRGTERTRHESHCAIYKGFFKLVAVELEIISPRLDEPTCALLAIVLVSYDHYRKRIKFRGPRYFRRPAHENKEGIFVGLVTDENPEYFRGPGAIFVGGPTKILNIFSSAS